MLLQDPNLNVWLYNRPADMRRQFDGLAALTQSMLHSQASGGDLFVFINRRRTMIKILYYSKGGYCLWAKRLERGRLHQILDESEKIPLSWAQLQCLIDGLDWHKMRKNKRLIREAIV